MEKRTDENDCDESVTPPGSSQVRERTSAGQSWADGRADRASLLAAIDAATLRGDVDEASALLARLMSPPPEASESDAADS